MKFILKFIMNPYVMFIVWQVARKSTMLMQINGDGRLKLCNDSIYLGIYLRIGCNDCRVARLLGTILVVRLICANAIMIFIEKRLRIQ